MGGTDTTVRWHLDALPHASRRALDFLSEQSWLRRSRWYLAGGTALALQAGHRRSVDLDFFTPQSSFSTAALLERLPPTVWSAGVLKEGTVYGKLLEAKVSFIAYPFFVPREEPVWYGAVRILVPRDIAVMKIIAISQRGTKRDFVDLYWYAMHGEPIIEVLRRVPKQYPTIEHNFQHIVKSLMYFEDAETDAMPVCTFRANWRTIKAYFRREVPKVARELLGLT